jgi:hypothetical protein
MYRDYKQKELDKMASSQTTLKTVVFVGSTRAGRNGLRVAKFIQKQLEEYGHQVYMIGNLFVFLSWRIFFILVLRYIVYRHSIRDSFVRSLDKLVILPDDFPEVSS